MLKIPLRSFLLFMGLPFFLVGTSFAELEYPKVLAVSGKAEILRPPSGWQKLEPAASLKKGFKIRTGEKSSVEIVWDAGLESAAKIDENSHLDILGQNSPRFFLTQGKFFVLREESISGVPSDPVLPIKIFTEDTLTEIEKGGCSVEVMRKETLVKIFSEKAKIFSLKGHRTVTEGKVADEGFKFFSGKIDPRISSRFQRMSYGDYTEWQAWVREFYEMKDDMAAEAFQRGTAL